MPINWRNQRINVTFNFSFFHFFVFSLSLLFLSAKNGTLVPLLKPNYSPLRPLLAFEGIVALIIAAPIHQHVSLRQYRIMSVYRLFRISFLFLLLLFFFFLTPFVYSRAYVKGYSMLYWACQSSFFARYISLYTIINNRCYNPKRLGHPFFSLSLSVPSSVLYNSVDVE